MASKDDSPWAQARALRKRGAMSSDRREEHRFARSIGGIAQPNSGRGMIHKGDVRGNGFLFDVKETSKDSYSISKETFDKIERQATATPPGLLPGLAINMNGRRLVVIRESDWVYFNQQLSLGDG